MERFFFRCQLFQKSHESLENLLQYNMVTPACQPTVEDHFDHGSTGTIDKTCSHFDIVDQMNSRPDMVDNIGPQLLPVVH